jgi:CheY-like chemotaxis protein
MAKIAIVDDSRLARTFTVNCLKRQGHELLEVDPTSVFEVLQRLRADPPNLILMDYLMPNCPGLSLARAVREDPFLMDVRVLMISALRDDEIQERLTRLGVEGFLSKPFEPQALVDLVATLLHSEA